MLNEDRFVDKAPETTHAMLLDEGFNLCSARTMYRILKQHGLVKERRSIARHKKFAQPELAASKPNQVWCWDVTKLRGARKGEYFYLYVAIDIYSRYVVGWMVANQESGGLAKDFIEHICQNLEIKANTLIVHSDRGAAMTSKTLKNLYDELQVERSLSRPRVSNDNPFVESHFKTLKYRPNYPKRFNCLIAAKYFCKNFFEWYNNEHRHSGIAFMTPLTVHNGGAAECSERRQRVLDAAYERHPERSVRGCPRTEEVSNLVCINQPSNGTICSIAVESSRKNVKRKKASCLVASKNELKPVV